MPLYEHVFLTRQDVSNTQVENLTKQYSQIITEAEGKVARTEYWGLKPLAYKIKKSRKAHFTMLNIDASPEAVAEMERKMRISTDILRFMTIKVDEHETEPSVMMRKNDRDDRRDSRGPRGGGGFRGGPPRDGGAPRNRGPRPPRSDNPSSEA